MMFKQSLKILLAIFPLIHTPTWAEGHYTGQKILYINSYHDGYDWSDGITKGVKDTLKDTGVELKIIYMDTKGERSEEFKQAAGLKAKATIDEFQPKVVITADDSAAKYVIMPYYKDATLPFVFCGINYDASIYGFPYKNVTGMIEVDLVSAMVKQMRPHAKGDKLGILSLDDFSERKLVDSIRKEFNQPDATTAFVKTFDEWKQRFLSLQDAVDMLLFVNPKGVTGWDTPLATEFAQQQTRIPTAATVAWMMPFTLLGLVKIPEEQGIYAAQTALKILDGSKPSDFPLVKNKEGKFYLNLKIAKKLGIAFPARILEKAEVIQ